jgi:hypothetical protein
MELLAGAHISRSLKMTAKKLCAAVLMASLALPAAGPLSAAAAGEMQMSTQGPIILAGNQGGWKNGYKGSQHYKKGWRQNNDGWWFPLAAFGVGAIVGSTLAQPRAVVVEGGDAHVQWCYSRYRSYRAWDNSFQPYNGPRRECYSPYG